MSIEENYKKNNVDLQQHIRSEMEDIKKGISKKSYSTKYDIGGTWENAEY